MYAYNRTEQVLQPIKQFCGTCIKQVLLLLLFNFAHNEALIQNTARIYDSNFRWKEKKCSATEDAVSNTKISYIKFPKVNTLYRCPQQYIML